MCLRPSLNIIVLCLNRPPRKIKRYKILLEPAARSARGQKTRLRWSLGSVPASIVRRADERVRNKLEYANAPSTASLSFFRWLPAPGSLSTNNGKERMLSRVTCHSRQINARVPVSGLRELASLVAVGLVGFVESSMDLLSSSWGKSRADDLDGRELGTN